MTETDTAGIGFGTGNCRITKIILQLVQASGQASYDIVPLKQTIEQLNQVGLQKYSRPILQNQDREYELPRHQHNQGIKKMVSTSLQHSREQDLSIFSGM